MTNQLQISNQQHAMQRAITPDVWGMLQAIVGTVSPSRVEQAKVAKHLLFCYENELPLSLATNGGLYTVNGRVEVEATVIRAQIRKHAHYDYRIDRLDNEGATVTITYDGEDIGSASFDMDDAKTAKLTGKDNWQMYAPDMFLARATSRAYKRFCPDIFYQAVYVRGEVQGNDFDIIEGDTVPQITMNDLLAQYSNEAIVEAMQATDGTVSAAAEWLENNVNQTVIENEVESE